MGLVEQLDWKLDDATVRVQPGPPLDITVVPAQGHDVIWHEVSPPSLLAPSPSIFPRFLPPPLLPKYSLFNMNFILGSRKSD
jgi:hypothetical protein